MLSELYFYKLMIFKNWCLSRCTHHTAVFIVPQSKLIVILYGALVHTLAWLEQQKELVVCVPVSAERFRSSTTSDFLCCAYCAVGDAEMHMIPNQCSMMRKSTTWNTSIMVCAGWHQERTGFVVSSKSSVLISCSEWSRQMFIWPIVF